MLIVSKQSQNVLKKLLNKVTKQDVSNIMNDLVDLMKENRDKMSEKSKDILEKLLHGKDWRYLDRIKLLWGWYEVNMRLLLGWHEVWTVFKWIRGVQ